MVTGQLTLVEIGFFTLSCWCRGGCGSAGALVERGEKNCSCQAVVFLRVCVNGAVWCKGCSEMDGLFRRVQRSALVPWLVAATIRL